MPIESTTSKSLDIPLELRPNPKQILPEITPFTLTRLSEYGWKKLGILVAIVDTAGKVLMLEHKAREKNVEGALGPLGETSKASGPIVEQPLQTLFRGLKEELGTDYPEEMGFSLHQAGGWAINRWPLGTHVACGVSFPVFVDDPTREHILGIAHVGEEVGAGEFMSPKDIMGMEDALLRPGVKPWLAQLGRAGLMAPGSEFGGVVPVSFTNLFEASLTDIEL